MKYKVLDYIKDNFNIDMVAYELISYIYDMNWMNLDKFVEILNNARIDITLEELNNLK